MPPWGGNPPLTLTIAQNMDEMGEQYTSQLPFMSLGARVRARCSSQV